MPHNKPWLIKDSPLIEYYTVILNECGETTKSHEIRLWTSL